jgi:hypothetical protein
VTLDSSFMVSIGFHVSPTRDQTCAGNEPQEKSHDESKVDVDRPRCVGAHGQWGKRTTPDRRSNGAKQHLRVVLAGASVLSKSRSGLPWRDQIPRANSVVGTRRSRGEGLCSADSTGAPLPAGAAYRAVTCRHEFQRPASLAIHHERRSR